MLLLVLVARTNLLRVRIQISIHWLLFLDKTISDDLWHQTGPDSILINRYCFLPGWLLWVVDLFLIVIALHLCVMLVHYVGTVVNRLGRLGKEVYVAVGCRLGGLRRPSRIVVWLAQRCGLVVLNRSVVLPVFDPRVSYLLRWHLGLLMPCGQRLGMVERGVFVTHLSLEAFRILVIV